MNKEKKIIHLDMDAFYASIEERDNPELIGKPVIVGSPPGTRGVVSTCNYIARKYGVRSAMSSTEAYRRCPHATFVKPHFKKYKEASDIVHSIMAEYTDKLEFVSLDEGYMDVTGSELLFGSAEKIAKEIQRRVYESVGTTCSVGVGYSLMSAKCASEEKKPKGFFAINNPEEFLTLMYDRPVGELYGIGKKTAERLTNMGIKTVGRLASTDPDRLASFGSMGAELINHARGIDNREVITDAAPKSIGRETTFLKDVTDRELLCDTLLLLSGDVSYRLYKHEMWGKTVTLKIKFMDMKSITRSYSGKYVRSTEQIYKIAARLLEHEALPKAVRLIGVSVSNLTDEPYVQLS
ncbi:MAG: DNA polymerase IV, partial [Clostridia bacterium]|nr:DNA polymerase IV [Clostridia bacterium]